MPELTGRAATWSLFSDTYPARIVSEPEQGFDGRTRVSIIAWSLTPQRDSHYLRFSKVELRHLAVRDPETSPVPAIDDVPVADLVAAQAKAQADYRAQNDGPALGSAFEAA